MGLFISVDIDDQGCSGMDACGQCAAVCPVGIFDGQATIPAVVGGNEDECTLCDLCINACAPRCIHIRKMYA